MRRSRGTTTASPQSQPPHSVDADAGSTRTGVECLPADFCRSLGGVSTAHPRYQTPYYDALVAKMLACGNPMRWAMSSIVASTVVKGSTWWR